MYIPNVPFWKGIQGTGRRENGGIGGGKFTLVKGQMLEYSMTAWATLDCVFHGDSKENKKGRHAYSAS